MNAVKTREIKLENFDSWKTEPIRLAHLSPIDYTQSAEIYHSYFRQRELDIIPDTFIYTFRKLAEPILTIGGSPQSQEIGQRAIVTGIKTLGPFPTQKNCNYFPLESHLFHMVTKGRYQDTETALKQFWGVILRTLQYLGVPYLRVTGNNLLTGAYRLGLLSGPKLKGAIHLDKVATTDPTDVISLSKSVNNVFPLEVNDKVFTGDKWRITSLQAIIGYVSAEAMLNALLTANSEIWRDYE